MTHPLAMCLRVHRLAVFLLWMPGCGSTDVPGANWTGTADTLASGRISVHNASGRMWEEGDDWLVVEDLRLGSPDAAGPDLFGQIVSLEIDQDGRFWILEQQTQELRVFSATGEHVRTVGRAGAGPGEFRQAAKIEMGSDGHMWVMDPSTVGFPCSILPVPIWRESPPQAGSS